MTMLDLIVVLVLLLSVIHGLARGLVDTLFSLGSWVLAFFGGQWSAALVGPMLPAAMGSPGTRFFVGFAVVFLVVLIVVRLITYAIVSIIKKVGLGTADKVLGGVAGLIQGVVILVVLTLAAGLTALPRTEFWKKALLADGLQAAAKRSLPLVPADVARYIRFE
jgi:membrane protein required for colicin V production